MKGQNGKSANRVSQGTILGFIFVLLFINDIFKNNLNGNLICSADYTAILATEKQLK